jgi:predicted RNase H-like HicB family nuclease
MELNKMMNSTEIIFLVEQDPEGGYIARALTVAIFTEAEDLDSLKNEIRDAIHCHFETEAERPKIIRLHIVRDEVFAA